MQCLTCLQATRPGFPGRLQACSLFVQSDKSAPEHERSNSAPHAVNANIDVQHGAQLEAHWERIPAIWSGSVDHGMATIWQVRHRIAL